MCVCVCVCVCVVGALWSVCVGEIVCVWIRFVHSAVCLCGVCVVCALWSLCVVSGVCRCQVYALWSV